MPVKSPSWGPVLITIESVIPGAKDVTMGITMDLEGKMWFHMLSMRLSAL